MRQRVRVLFKAGRPCAGAQVHVSWMDSGTAVFAFRGTESAQDGLQDVKMMRRHIDYLQQGYPGAKAHTGPAFRMHALLCWHVDVAKRRCSTARSVGLHIRLFSDRLVRMRLSLLIWNPL